MTKVPSGAPKLEDLHAGASVVSRDGHKVGTLRRFVVRKDDLVLTHIVVDTGIFRSGDWNGAIGLSTTGCCRWLRSSLRARTRCGSR